MSNDFVTMKGFLEGFTVKSDGHTEETLPNDTGTDVTESAELDSAQANAPKADNIKPSDNKPAGPGTTMEDELQDVAEKAEEDIADGYVSDSQHLPGPGDRVKKGYEAFNEMVGKGYVTEDYGLNVNNIEEAFDRIEKSAEASFNSAAEYSSPWLVAGEGMTVFKGASAADMIFKGDPEDMGVDEGLTEEPGPEDFETASDDTKGEIGENDETPQTEEAETEDQNSNADTGLSGEAEKGFEAFNSMVAKGYVIEEKAGYEAPSRIGRGVQRAAQWARGKLKPDKGPFQTRLSFGGGKDKTKREKLADIADRYSGKKAEDAAKNIRRAGVGAAGVGAIGTGAYLTAGHPDGRDRKKKGYEDYNDMVTKGFVVEEKAGIVAPSRTGRAVQRLSKWAKEKIKPDKGPWKTRLGKQKDDKSIRGRAHKLADKYSGIASESAAKNIRRAGVGAAGLGVLGTGAYAYKKGSEKKKK